MAGFFIPSPLKAHEGHTKGTRQTGFKSGGICGAGNCSGAWEVLISQ